MKNKQMMIVVIAIVIILGLSFLLGRYKTNIQEIIKNKIPWINQLVKNNKIIDNSQEQDYIEGNTDPVDILSIVQTPILDSE